MSGAALATTTPTQAGIITTAQAFKGSLENWRQHQFHVLTPAAAFTALPPQWGLLPVKVEINIDEAFGEVYQDKLFCKADEVCLTKNGLSKIAQAVGMSITTERTDPRTIANYWEVRATARFIGLDGTPQQLQATEELDLRDGTERSQKVMGRDNKVGALVAARAKGLRNCEARAINAVIRLYGLKQKYTRDELRKPFMAVRMLFQPDMNNPTQAAIATQQALGGVSMLYPSTPLASLPPAQPEVLDVIGQVADSHAHQGTHAKAQEPAAPAPRKVDAVEIDLESGVHAITFEGGANVLTDQLDVAKAAQTAKKAGAGVLVTSERRGSDVYVTDLQVAQTQPGTKAAEPTTGAASMPDGSTTIVNIKTADSKPGAGRPWRRYDVEFANGVIASTFSQTIQQLADDAHRHRARVRIQTSEREGYNDSLDKLEIIDSRQQSLPNPGEL